MPGSVRKFAPFLVAQDTSKEMGSNRFIEKGVCHWILGGTIKNGGENVEEIDWLEFGN